MADKEKKSNLLAVATGILSVIFAALQFFRDLFVFELPWSPLVGYIAAGIILLMFLVWALIRFPAFRQKVKQLLMNRWVWSGGLIALTIGILWFSNRKIQSLKGRIDEQNIGITSLEATQTVQANEIAFLGSALGSALDDRQTEIASAEGTKAAQTTVIAAAESTFSAQATELALDRSIITRLASEVSTLQAGATPTSTLETSGQPPEPSTTITYSATLTDTPTLTPTGAVLDQFISVPNAVVSQFFSPGPRPATLAVAGDSLWVADHEKRLLYQLDRGGIPLASFPITLTGKIRGLVWDGEALYLALAQGDHSTQNQVARLDTSGTLLESFPLPIEPTGLGWDLDEHTFWTANGRFLLEFNTDGRLLRTLHAPTLTEAYALTWAPDGLWVVDVFRDWYCFSFTGEKVRSDDLPIDFWGYLALAWDERGYLWLTVERDRLIYQLSLRQEEAEARPSPAPDGGAELALPHPQLDPAPATDYAIVHVANNLQGTLSLSFGDEAAILQPGDIWSAELDPGVYTVYASVSVPKPIAFSGEEFLVGGYEYTWSLERPE